MSEQCRAVLLTIEEGGVQDPAVAAHVASCTRCARHLALLGVLAELPPRTVDEQMVSAVMASLPRARWQLRRVVGWIPALAGAMLATVGLALAGGVPGRGAFAALGALPSRVAGWVADGALDLWTALQGSSDAVAAVAGVAGVWLVIGLALAGLGGGWLVLAAVRRRSGPSR